MLNNTTATGTGIAAVTAQELAVSLGGETRKSNGGYMARCPAHDDNNPSLSIDDGPNDPLVKCFAGCDQTSVITALKNRGLWPEQHEFEINHPSRGKPDQVWAYHSTSGAVIGYACRFNKAGGKDVLPFFKHDEGWRWKAPEDPRPLYNLHSLSKDQHKKVLIVEGEKAADAAQELCPDYTVITWQGGSGAVGKADLSTLEGRSVTIWPDADNPGHKAARKLAEITGGTIITPRGEVAEGWDAADALAEGCTPDRVWDLFQERPDDNTKKPIELQDIATLLAGGPIEVNYLVDGAIEDQTTGALFGESTAGKSFIAIDLSCCVATGEPWAGHSIKRTGPVIYFAGEGRNGIPRRVKAWQDHHNRAIPEGKFFLPRVRVEFDAAGARLIASELDTLPEPPALIIIDTLARCLPSGSDENSAKDMMSFINEVDNIRDRFRCVVCIVHHTGHGTETQSRARGSSTFKAAMDWELLVDKKGTLRWTKMKDSELPEPVGFELVDTGESAAVDYSDTPQPALEKLTRNEEIGFETLQTACAPQGWCDLEAWRAEFYRRHTGDNTASKRVAFNRVRESLAAKQKIIVDRDIYKPCVTSVTERNKVTNVTGTKRNKRNTPLWGVTSVTVQNNSEELQEEDFFFGVSDAS